MKFSFIDDFNLIKGQLVTFVNYAMILMHGRAIRGTFMLMNVGWRATPPRAEPRARQTLRIEVNLISIKVD